MFQQHLITVLKLLTIFLVYSVRSGEGEDDYDPHSHRNRPHPTT